jgi:predicted DNA-binding protein with PD1-like motif
MYEGETNRLHGTANGGNITMRKTILMLMFLAFVGGATAQQTRTEETRASSPSDDTKPNSNTIPDVYAMNGQFECVVVLRLKYDVDLLTGLETMVKQEKIHNAVILSGIGSVRGYHIHSVINRTFPTKVAYVKDPTASADIVSMNGYVIDGRVHAHMMMANDDRSFGGHLAAGTPVFTFAIVTLGVFKDGIDLSRVDDRAYR